jgi:hypothetical protein
MPNTSPKYTLNLIDIWKIFRGLLVLLFGAALTYLSQVYMNIDYSFMANGHAYDLTPIATVALGSVIETGRRWLTDHSGEEKPLG